MIEVYTANTPNGIKIPIVLEELGVPYRIIGMNLSNKDQKQASFLKINPNGRIPAIVDTEVLDKDGNHLTVFESGAILLYLAEKYSSLLGETFEDRTRVLEWLFFQMGGIGPMFGQANFFNSSEEYPSQNALQRFRVESQRLVSVLESRLSQHQWLAGEHYTIADIANYSWLRYAESAAIEMADYPAVAAWREKIEQRLAVHRGINRTQNPDRQFGDAVASSSERMQASA
ncbi:MAG: glutathione binding-like protein [Pseudomonadales bacterium]|nr:glutathione binding-like protein [Pseudomonadales bacterium]